MNFVMLLYQGTTPLPGSDAWAALSQDEQKQIYAEYGELNKDPRVTGGIPMAPPDNAITVRVENGRTFTTNGPFAETNRAVGGYLVFEADDLDAAIELAARIPAARLGGAIEIRPSQKYW